MMKLLVVLLVAVALVAGLGAGYGVGYSAGHDGRNQHTRHAASVDSGLSVDDLDGPSVAELLNSSPSAEKPEGDPERLPCVACGEKPLGAR